MSNQKEEKVVEMTKKKASFNRSFLRWKIKTILFCIAITVCCCIATAYVVEKKCIENPYKAIMDMETLPCGLPLEMCYVNQIESGIYVTASYYGTCILDINIDKDRKNAEVYVVFYPGDVDVYGFPTYQRYNCKVDDKGNLVESLETNFILAFDKDDHQIMLKIINDDSFKKNVYKNMTQTPFSCIWLNSEK